MALDILSTNNTFNDFAIAATEDHPLISQMSFIHKPQVGADLFDVNPLETDLGEMAKMGLMKEVMGEEIIHHESNKRFQAPLINTSTTVGSVYGTQSGGTFDGLDYIRLSAASHSPASGTGALAKSYPRAGQLCEFKNGAVWRIAGKDETTAGEHKLFLTKVQASMPAMSATITLSGSTYGGDQFSVFSTAFEEATSGMLTGIIPTSKTYTNYLQSFYDTYEITDFAERNETYPLTFNKKPINFWYVKGLDDTDLRFGAAEQFGCTLTPKDDGNLKAYNLDGTTPKVSTTQGYLPALKNEAAKMYYGNTPTIDLYENILRKRKKLYQGKQSQLQHGYEYGLLAKDIISQFGVEGSMIYNRKSVDLNIDMIRIAHNEFGHKELISLGHPDFTDVSGFPYPYYFIIAPVDKTKDAKTGIMKDAYCLYWKRMIGKGARGHYKIWETGGNSKTGTTGKLHRVIHISSRKGIGVIGASKFILGRKAA